MARSRRSADSIFFQRDVATSGEDRTVFSFIIIFCRHCVGHGTLDSAVGHDRGELRLEVGLLHRGPAFFAVVHSLGYHDPGFARKAEGPHHARGARVYYQLAGSQQGVTQNCKY